jgi:hypothetical protein
VENDNEIYCEVFRKREYLGDVIVRCTKEGELPNHLSGYQLFNMNCVKKNQFDAHLPLVYFVNLYMFRAYLCPSSGGATVYTQQLVLIIIFW